MAGSVNKVILIGNLGADPEIRSLGSGDRVANLRIATSETWRDRATGERKEKTEWHRVVIFNENLGGIAERFLKKGSTVYIEGQLQTREWTDNSGVKKYTTEIVLQQYRGELTLLGGRDGGGGGARSGPMDGDNYDYGDSPSASPAPSGGGRSAPARSKPADFDDDIPF